MLSIKYSRVGKAVRILLYASLFLLNVAIPFGVSPQSTAIAAGCSGSGCTGLNPSTMGCGTGALTGPYTSSGGALIENRYNTTCDAEWERTTNQSGSSRYAAGSIRYGCANYCYDQSVSSPSAIANGQAVYTPMMGPDGSTSAINCGKVSTTGPIATPVTVNCTTVS
jgi:hypothetical protein